MLVWLSLDTWLILSLSIGYLVLLFFIAFWAQKKHKSWKNKSWIYSLSLGVSCSSWAFYGTISQAASTGQWIAPIYIGTIACFILGWPILLKLLRVSKKLNLTSVADFIACRFDKAPQIAAVVSIIALLGTLPYIALQLRAVSHSFDLVTGSFQSGSTTTLMVTVVLIIFSILFGARHAEANKQNTGLLVAIAFSSIVKLAAILCVGLFVTFGLFDGFESILSQAPNVIEPSTSDNSYLVVSQLMIGFLTIFVTPQLYHMIVIENDSEKQLNSARWGYPLYLILINIFVLPIAIAGLVTFPGGGISADTFMLTIPLFHQQAWISIFVYIGGLAAATSMVIVAAIVLSTLITTEIVSPIILKLRFLTSRYSNPTQQLSGVLLFVRRLSIAAILVLSLLFDYIFNQSSELASIGLLSFVLLAQTAPAVLSALYWKNASSKGAMWGLIVGSTLWTYCLLLPTLWPDAHWVNNGLFNIEWLNPTALFGITSFDFISHGLFLSLLGNSAVLYLHSIYTKRSLGENLQANQFVRGYSKDKNKHHHEYQITYVDLIDLLNRFIDEDAVNRLKQLIPSNTNLQGKAPAYLVDFTQMTLASVLGSASTKLVMSAVSEADDTRGETLEQVANIVDEANQIFEFNRELLQAGVENIEQGISVVDADMKLVAWNSRYKDLLAFPDGYLKSGMHIGELIEFNVQRNMILGEDTKALIEKRLEYMRQGNDHYYQRTLPSGIVLEIRGQAMPGGGFVSTFSDITRHIESEKALQKANETLEQRVTERTQELEIAIAEAEAANSSKTRFLAAASHDLMQPFNALSLFNSMLQHKTQHTDLEELATNIDGALQSAEGLLNDLVEISKLDSGVQRVDLQTFKLNDILIPLNNEFSALSKQAGIEFKFVKSSITVTTDKQLLRRILQNFLANAIRYAPAITEQFPNRQVKIVFGVKRVANSARIMIVDNGPGIPEGKLLTIFKEFERLNINQERPGLGLGLAICERISAILDLPIEVKSKLQQGANFSITLPIAEPNSLLETNEVKLPELAKQSFNGLTAAIIDNDPLIVTALSQQLTLWGFDVITSGDKDNFVNKISEHKDSAVSVIIADYHLDNGETGTETINELKSRIGWQGLAIICSADPSDTLRQTCIDNEFGYIRKPVKAHALKRLLKSQLLER